MQYNEQHLGK